MTDSLSLITAQISFLDAQVVLIHVPIQYYSFLLQPILRLLFGEDHDEDAAAIPWTNRHDFFNLSISDIECSIICSEYLAQKYIAPVQKALQDVLKVEHPSDDVITIYRETYIVIQVDGQGLDAGQRVLELTGPLAMAGISIFFITTYFCDYVLVPSRARRTVTVALEQRGFVFSKENDAFISQLSPALTHTHLRNVSFSSDESRAQTDHYFAPSMPSTPPAKDIDELQYRTFKKLKHHRIRPRADKRLRLVGCAGSREPDAKKDETLKNDLLQVLLSSPKKLEDALNGPAGNDRDVDRPNDPDFSTSFLSLTMTASDPISMLLEERLLPRLGQSLYGAKSADDILVPIVFDLSDLAFETAGIVGGVAGRLGHGNSRQTSYMGEQDINPTDAPAQPDDCPTEISFLSTARAGTVIVKASQLEQALRTLNQALEERLDKD